MPKLSLLRVLIYTLITHFYEHFTPDFARTKIVICNEFRYRITENALLMTRVWGGIWRGKCLQGSDFSPHRQRRRTLLVMADRSRRDKVNKLDRLAEYKRAREGEKRVLKVCHASSFTS